MKKKILIVLMTLTAIFCLCFGLTACGGKVPDSNGSQQTGSDNDEQGGSTNGEQQSPSNNEQSGEQQQVPGSSQDDDSQQSPSNDEQSGDEQQNPDGDKQDEGGQQKPNVEQGEDEPQNSGGEQNDDEEQKPDDEQDEGKPEHKHEYNIELAEEEYLKSEATCTKKAVYYYSCECGEKGTNTFESGQLKEHTYTTEELHCDVCGKRNPAIASERLKYALSEDKTYYSVSGIGACSETDIVIPATYEGLPVTSIDSQAFSYCSSLTSITIPDGVTSIAQNAFYDCSSLTSITIPNSVTSMGKGAFSSCISLTIYCEVESQPSGWNSNWNNSSCPVVWNCKNNDKDESGYAYTVVEGVRYSLKNGVATVIKQPSNITTANMKVSVIYNGETYDVTSIGYGAFRYCRSLTSITIPDGVTSIGGSAFYSCSSLTSITIPNSVTSIGEDAFAWCKSLGSVSIPDGVTSIGGRAFYNCSSLESVTIHGSVWSIGNYAFEGCDELTSITILRGVRYIGECAFRHCTSLTSITIPNSVTSIGGNAFDNCSELNRVNIEDIAAWCKINFYGSSNPLCYAHNLYLNNELITNLVIPDSVKSIGESAFNGCSSLTSVTIPDGVKSIGESAFNGCSSLKSIIFGENSQLTSIGYGAFRYCSSLTSITIPDGVTSIAQNAFYNCSSLIIYCEAVTKPSGWDSGWKGNCPVVWNCKNNDKDEDGYEYAVIDGIRYSLKNGVATVVGQYDNMVVVDIPVNVTYRGEIYSVTGIGYEAFRGCSSLTSITIPDSVTSIGSIAFYNCSSLERVTICSGVTSIESYAFQNCRLLKSITIPNSVTSIGNGAFYNCRSLISITIPNSVTSIGESAFYYCSLLTSITVDENNANYKSIDGNLYSKDGKTLIHYAIGKTATNFTIPAGVTSIGIDAFSGCNSLKSVTISDSVTSIGKSAFYYCSSLTSITIPNSVTSIRSYAFGNCSSLTIYCEAESESSGWDSYWNNYYCPVVWNCKNNDKDKNGYAYTVVDGIRYSLKDGIATVVRQPSNITTANIPSSVTYKGETYSVTSIGYDAFEYCSSLESVTIPNNVTSIEEYAFRGCSSLTNITIPNSVTSIGYKVFFGCSSLESITFNGTEEQWNSISKSDDWNKNSGDYTVHCTDGDIEKS